MELAIFHGKTSMHLPREIKCKWSTTITTMWTPDGVAYHDYALEIPAKEMATLSDGVKRYQTENGQNFYAHYNSQNNEWYFLSESEAPFKIGDIVATYSWRDSNITIDRIKNAPKASHMGWAYNEDNHCGLSLDFRLATPEDFKKALAFYETQRDHINSKIEYLEELQKEAMSKNGLDTDGNNPNINGDAPRDDSNPESPKINESGTPGIPINSGT